MTTKSHSQSHSKPEHKDPVPHERQANKGAPESGEIKDAQDKKGIKPIKPIESPGKTVFDVESHKITELFASGDVVFTREGGAGELRAQPAHEAKTRFVEIAGEIESTFKDSQTTINFKLKDGRTVTQTGHHTVIVGKDGKIDDDSPSLNIHAADFQG